MADRNNPDFLSASTLKGDKVVNAAGEDLGKIEELMIDLHDGRLAFAVLSFGGFLGMGDKLFAIPWQALRLKLHDHAFVLDVPKDVLEKAEGFDKDNWPITSREWLSTVYGYYGYQPYWQRVAGQTGISTGMPAGRESERMARMETERRTGMPGETESERMARMGTAGMPAGRESERMARMETERLTGMPGETESERMGRMGTAGRDNPDFLSAGTLKGDKVVSTAGEDIGKIEEFMIDLQDGKVGYVVVSHGGFLGIGNKLFAVPWQALTLKMHEHAFVLNVPKETIEKSEGFDKDHWPLTREELSRTYSYYGYEPYWQKGVAAPAAGVTAAMPRETESERTARMERETVPRTESTTDRGMPDFLSASTIKGDKIVNAAGDDLGKIEELMIDLRDGRLAYAVMSFGGFLGMGDKLFAIPWQALRLKLHDHAFVLDIPKETLEKAEGFDKDNWPITSREWLSTIYGYYGYQPYWQIERSAPVAGVSVELPGETESQRMARMGRTSASRENPDFLSAGTLKGDKVVSAAGEDIGKIEELMIDLQNGKVGYVVVSHGGLLGVGNKLFAVPWQAFTLRVHEHAFALDAPKETFEKAEGFDKDHWPLTREELSRTYSYYGYQPYWQTGMAAPAAGVSAEVPRETESERMARMEREEKARAVSTTGREMPDFLSASTIKKDKVVNRAGEDLGKIEELMIDLENGRIAYAVLSFGGFLGMADKLFAIPWQALTLRLHEHAFLLDISKDVLEKAEGFDKDNWPLTREELSRAYTYYGYKPYWQGEVTERAEIPRETQPQRTTRTERKKSFETAEELIAEQEKERIEQLEKTETDKERLERLEREKAIAERREHKYH